MCTEQRGGRPAQTTPLKCQSSEMAQNGEVTTDITNVHGAKKQRADGELFCDAQCCTARKSLAVPHACILSSAQTQIPLGRRQALEPPSPTLTLDQFFLLNHFSGHHLVLQ